MFSNNFRFTAVTVFGTLLEWAEFCIYGYLAAKISSLFFPQFDPQTGLLATFGIFAVGYFARPLGGVIFGHIGDTYGRKKALTFSMAIMGVATMAIGFLPTYAEIGIAAPILLMFCRILQGLSVSGEFNGAAIFLIEHAQPGRKNLAGCWVGAAAASGMLIGALMVALISYDGLPIWVWRVPFLIGALSCSIGFYLRRNFTETPEFISLQEKHQTPAKIPLLASFKYNKVAMLQTAAIAAFIGIYVYICNIYFATFLHRNAGFSVHSALMIAAFGQGCTALLFPLMGKIADAWDGRKLLLLGLLGAAIVAPLVFILGMMHSIVLALCAQFIYAIFDAMSGAPVFNYINGLFPTERRYTGITVAWSLSVALFAGTAPMVAEYWVGTLQFIQGPALYVSLSALIAFITLFVSSVRSTSARQVALSVNNLP